MDFILFLFYEILSLFLAILGGLRARSLVVSNFHSETEGFWFKSGCKLFAVIARLMSVSVEQVEVVERA